MENINQLERGSKERFVANYLNQKMKNHNLPYGMEYFSLLSKHEEAAEKIWKRKVLEDGLKQGLNKKYPKAKITFK